MSCLLPPALDNDQLLSYLAGNAPAEVRQHLEQCPDCHSRLEVLQDWQSWLAKNLYRTPCPSSLELGEYSLGVLSDEQKAKIEQHLAWCSYCKSELQIFDNRDPFLEAAPPRKAPQQIVDLAQIIIARLREDLAELQLKTPTRALAGMRGQESVKSLIYDADDIEISLLIKPDVTQPTQRMMLGWMSGYENIQPFEVYLWQGTQQIGKTEIDNLGNFAFSTLLPGQYELMLQSDTQEIYINNLDL